mgnify:CR=1 FL=1
MLRFDLMPRTGVVRRDSRCLNPNVDISENDKEFRLSFEIPGIVKEDVKIWIENDLLTISGEKKGDFDDNDKRHLSERAYGKFERSFWMPEEADRENIKAEFNNGILTVIVMKTEKAKPVEIKIS